MTNDRDDLSKVQDALRWLVRFAGRLSPKVTLEILTMIELMKARETPLWVKGVVAGALAYAVLPLDAIPDLLPVAGLTDDAGVIATAYMTAMRFVTPEMRKAAQAEFERLTSRV